MFVMVLVISCVGLFRCVGNCGKVIRRLMMLKLRIDIFRMMKIM